MGLRDSILTKPREASGAAAANRFDFQKSWALCKLFELHESPHEYVLILEQHEDVVVFLFDPSGAESAECFQIKTKAPHLSKWGLTELLKREKKAAPGTPKGKGKKAAKPKLVPGLSIIGKMYHNRLVMGAGVTSLNFVTNQAYTVTLNGGVSCAGRNTICLNELEAADVTNINTQVAAEHGLPNPVTDLVDRTHLKITDLSLQDHASHTCGRCGEFLEKRTPGRPYAVPAVHRALAEEVRRRADYEWTAVTFEGVVKHKAITRAAFQRMLDSIPQERRFDVVWSTIQPQLTSEGEVYTDTMAIKRQCKSVEMDRMNALNTVVAELQRCATAERDSLLTDAAHPTLREKLAEGVRRLRAKVTAGNTYTDDYLKAMLVMTLNDY